MITLFNETKSFDYMNDFINAVMKAKVALLRNGIISAANLSNFTELLPKDRYNVLNVLEGQDILIYIQSNIQDIREVSKDILFAFIRFLSTNKYILTQVLKDDQFTLNHLFSNTTFPGLMYSVESFPGARFAIRF